MEMPSGVNRMIRLSSPAAGLMVATSNFGNSAAELGKFDGGGLGDEDSCPNMAAVETSQQDASSVAFKHLSKRLTG